jgi:hypothetical protein
MKHTALFLTFLTALGLLANSSAINQDEPAWKQACRPKEEEMEQCLANQLTIVEAETCVQCLQTELQAHQEGGTMDCGTAEDDICESIRDCSSVCGDCSAHTEAMFKCAFEETVPMCPELHCNTPSGQHPESPSTPTDPASSGNEPAWKQTCQPKEQEMEQCVASELTLSGAESCAQCLQDELRAHQERTSDCIVAEHEICESIQDCSSVCGDCSVHTEEMFRCVWDATVPMCPDLVCDQVMIQYQQKVKVHNILYFCVLGLVMVGVAARIIVGRRHDSQDGSVIRQGYVAGREYDTPVRQIELDVI